MAQVEWDEATQAAWGRFRSRLGDRLAAMDDDDVLVVDVVVGVADEELTGAAPYVQFVGWDGGLLRAEAAGNAALDERFRLSADDERRLLELGWSAPTTLPDEELDEGSPNYYADAERREADRLSWMAVHTLQQVYDCPHPAFLSAGGLEHDGAAAVPERDGAASPAPAEDEPIAEFPRSPDALQGMVDRALTIMFGSPAEHDEDGDIGINCGLSRVFVRVVPDQPAVEIFSFLVVDLPDPDAALLEVSLVNRSYPHAKLFVRDDYVLMQRRVCAFPFAGAQLRSEVSRMCQDVDDLARDMVARLGGRRFGDVPEEADPAEEARQLMEIYAGSEADDDLDEDDHPGLVGLLELLEDGPVRRSTAAALFDFDRLELVRQLVRVRTGAQSVGDADPEEVLHVLRGALRWVADKEVRDESPRPLPPRRTSQQLALLSESDADPAGPGLWEHGAC